MIWCSSWKYLGGFAPSNRLSQNILGGLKYFREGGETFHSPLMSCILGCLVPVHNQYLLSTHISTWAQKYKAETFYESRASLQFLIRLSPYHSLIVKKPFHPCSTSQAIDFLAPGISFDACTIQGQSYASWMLVPSSSGPSCWRTSDSFFQFPKYQTCLLTCHTLYWCRTIIYSKHQSDASWIVAASIIARSQECSNRRTVIENALGIQTGTGISWRCSLNKERSTPVSEV